MPPEGREHLERAAAAVLDRPRFVQQGCVEAGSVEPGRAKGGPYSSVASDRGGLVTPVPQDTRGAAVGGDPQQLLSRAPAIKLGDLTKGEAVMLVATQGAPDVTAVSLLAGVEPLLQAPASQSLLSNWSMGSGGAEGASAQ